MKQKGFTLAELSISIVIISVIMGGVISATNIMRTARLKIIIKEAREYQAAFDRFKDKFKYYPGDFPSGGSFWGKDCNDTPTGTDLCSGDGNFKIRDGANDALTGTSETFVAWRHLQRSSVLPGSLSGLKGTGNNCPGNGDTCAVVGMNVPKSSWDNATGYYILSGTSEIGLFLGGQVADSWNNKGVLKPEDSQNIDLKIDDGDPINGYFRASFIAGATLLTSATCLDTATTYNLDNNTTDCGAIFILDGQK
ncbi:MAG: prepilin-type N-terminal cleavage/methylation protein [Rickettsiaceae bacterium]|jgi:prepilin-type N-terminal cleavage/methylation domain-containing protein|nr:prepilin-type N-terminal cleavage/methylation protein [Rickettsiaceae bacterium]